MRIEYELPRRRQPIYACFKGILRLFRRRVRTVALGGAPQERCLYLANHANKMGPMIYDMFFPVYHVKWGAHEMLGNYSTRRRYLRDVLYIRKNGMGKKKAGFKAFFEAFFSKYIYRGMKFLPTYPDARLVKTVKKSVDVLDAPAALMIFPENSNAGYHDLLTEFFPGFVLVMERYRQVKGADLPVRPVYYHRKKRLIVVGEPCFLGEFEEKGMRRGEIAETFRQKVNALYQRIERGEFDNKKTRSEK